MKHRQNKKFDEKIPSLRVISSVNKFSPLLFLFSSLFFSINRTLSFGRASAIATYDDISYISAGAELCKNYLKNGQDAILHWISQPPHSISYEFIAFLGNCSSKYSQNSVYLMAMIINAFLLAAVILIWIQNYQGSLIITSFVILSPLGYTILDQFRPDLQYSIIFFGILGIIRRMHDGEGSIDKLVIYNLFGLILLFIVKPTWFAYSFILLVFSIFVIRIKKFKFKTKTKKIIILQLISLSLVVSSYIRHIYNYVFVWALQERKSTLADSGISAVLQSIKWGVEYVSWPFIRVLALAYIIIIFTNIRKSIYLRNYKNFDYKFYFLNFCLLIPVLISRHPSPFEGLFLILVSTLFISIKIVSFLLTNNWNIKRISKYTIKGLMFFGLMFIATLPPVSTTPIGESAEPILITKRIATEINTICNAEVKCQSLDRIKVMVGVITDVTPQGMNFYAVSAKPEIMADSNLMTNEVFNEKDFLKSISSYNFVVISKENLDTVGIPWNGNQILMKNALEKAKWKMHEIRSTKYLILENFN